MELMSKAPASLQDLLQHMSLTRSRSGYDHELLAGLALFATGLLVGAGLGILFAPSSGEKIRGEIAGRLTEARERLRAGSSAEQPSPTTRLVPTGRSETV
jgi:hypothetical protein